MFTAWYGLDLSSLPVTFMAFFRDLEWLRRCLHQNMQTCVEHFHTFTSMKDAPLTEACNVCIQEYNSSFLTNICTLPAAKANAVLVLRCGYPITSFLCAVQCRKQTPQATASSLLAKRSNSFFIPLIPITYC